MTQTSTRPEPLPNLRPDAHPADYAEAHCVNCGRPAFWTAPRPRTFWAHMHNDSPSCGSGAPGRHAEVQR